VGSVQARAFAAVHADAATTRTDPSSGAHLLSRLDPGHLARTWRESLLHPPTSRHHVLVALEPLAGGAEEVVGFVATGPAAEPDLDAGAVGELLVIAVDPTHIRGGHGSRLLNAAIDQMIDDGFRAAVAWLPSDDEVTRAFLAGSGWVTDGAHRHTSTLDDSASLQLIRMVTRLDDPAEH
jgi:ribosomal protein S18 acetylase RimI-like enzyme